MSLKSFAFATLLTAALGIVSGSATAQSGFDVEPVNLPPSGFDGRQFVDNRGCIFVRAGFDGNTTWVPRVTRSRQQICGQTPTFGTTSAAAAPAARPAPAARAAPAQITPEPAPAAAPVTARAPQPAAVAVVRPAPQPSASTSVVRTAPRAQTAPVPRVMPAPASKPYQAEPPRVIRRVPTVAPAAPVIVPGQRMQRLDAETCRYGWVYREVNGVRQALNCRPVSEIHGSLENPAVAPHPGKRVTLASGGGLPGHTRIVPRHVYENRAPAAYTVPHGYRPAWEDDRLNPYRAWQTVDGYRDTQQVWTNTVPRRLVTQARPWWQTGHEVKHPVIAYRADDARTAYLSTQGSTARDAVISTRSAPVKPSARYVEIGVFTTPAKAEAAAARVAAAGLPVRYGRYKDMTRVMVGPYADPAALQAALRRVHGTGYVQAYLR